MGRVKSPVWVRGARIVGSEQREPCWGHTPTANTVKSTTKGRKRTRRKLTEQKFLATAIAKAVSTELHPPGYLAWKEKKGKDIVHPTGTFPPVLAQLHVRGGLLPFAVDVTECHQKINPPLLAKAPGR